MSNLFPQTISGKVREAVIQSHHLVGKCSIPAPCKRLESPHHKNSKTLIPLICGPKSASSPTLALGPCSSRWIPRGVSVPETTDESPPTQQKDTSALCAALNTVPPQDSI